MIPRNSVAAIPAQVLHILKAAATMSLVWRVLLGALLKITNLNQGQTCVLGGGDAKVSRDMN